MSKSTCLAVIGVLLMCLYQMAEASQASGPALIVRQTGSTSDHPVAKVGDVLDLELVLDKGGATVAGTATILIFDLQYLEVIPFTDEFAQGGGGFGHGSSLTETLDNPFAASIPKSRLGYITGSFGYVPGKFDKVAGIADGALVRFRMRVLKQPPDGIAYIGAAISDFGVKTLFTRIETGYFVQEDEKNIYRFGRRPSMSITVLEGPETTPVPFKPGGAHLVIRQEETGDTRPTVNIGDILDVELFVDPKGEPLIGSAVYLSFNPAYLALVPEGKTEHGVKPFIQGTWLESQRTPPANGIVSDRGFIPEIVQDTDFQLGYVVDLRFEADLGSSYGSFPVVTESGTLAQLRFRVIGKPDSGPATVQADSIALTGHSMTGYFLETDLGFYYGFDRIEPLVVTVQGDPQTVVAASDFNGNGTVDFPDFLELARALGSTEDRYDLNGNGTVDFPDFLAFAKYFGKSVEP